MQSGHTDGLWELSLLSGRADKQVYKPKTCLRLYISVLRHHPVCSSRREVVYLCTSITEKAPKASTAQRDQTALNKKSNTIGWWLLLGHLIGSTTHISARLGNTLQIIVGSWRETVLPLLVIFWHCFPLFLIYDIHLWGNLLLVDFGEHLLPLSFSPCHPCLIKTITDTWLCVWLDSFRNVAL